MNRINLLNLISPLAPAVSRITGGHILLRDNAATAVNESFSITMLGEHDLSCCPDYASLKSALSGLTGDALTVSESEAAITLNARGRRTVRCLPVDTFPALPDDEADDIAAVDGDALRDALTFAVRAVGVTADMPFLCGVHLNGRDVVATDRNQLHITKLKDDMPTCTIPTASAQALVRLLEGQVTLALGRRLTVKSPSFIFSTSLATPGFPAKYPQVIPDETGTLVEMDVEETLRAVNAVSAFADSKTKRVFMAVCGGNVTLSCDAAEEPLDVVAIEGDDRKVLFNAGLMADSLASFKSGRVKMWMKENREAPLRIADDAGRVAVVMPMKY